MLRISRSAIRHNIELLRTAAPQSKFMAVVKDDAYGQGLVAISEVAVNAGTDWLGVVHVWEGIALRQAGIELPILVLGYVPPADIPQAINYKLDVPIMNLDHAVEARNAIPDGKRLRIHLKVETGLHRFGTTGQKLLELAKFVGVGSSASSSFVPIGIYSHLAAAEEAEMEYTQQQLKRFATETRKLGDQLLRHIGATAATLMLPESHFDMVRCGIGIYGLWPSEEVKIRVKNNGDDLQPALEWVEPVRAVKSVDAGQPVGYGCTWRPRKDSRVALLDVGYADGLPRSLSGSGMVEILGRACPIVGRLCSNVTFINVTDVPQAAAGDEATLIAARHDSPVLMEAQAERAGTINYELAIRLPRHLERHYVD